MDLVHELWPVQILEVTKKRDNLSGWLASIQHLAHIYFIRSVPASNWGKNGRYKNNEDRENIMRCFIHCCHGNGGWALAPLSPECSHPGRVKCECWRQFFTQHSLLKFDPAAQPSPAQPSLAHTVNTNCVQFSSHSLHFWPSIRFMIQVYWLKSKKL